ncbi:hypothetical protein EVAR_8526_1 [Eumeta japonica]|uniref:Histone-lysine N-methyltransferase SETMAR n=1 Tax=Eumeta variegata TaxID=151549 RepID=A0A4C1TXC4_EUMVA|nr:hypothetical protein EVAR_8526_1 [Eumeta japonica]
MNSSAGHFSPLTHSVIYPISTQEAGNALVTLLGMRVSMGSDDQVLSAEATRFSEGQKIEMTGHPPYSTDLSSNNFYLFPSVKNKLRGLRFSSREEAVNALKMLVLEIP